MANLTVDAGCTGLLLVDAVIVKPFRFEKAVHKRQFILIALTHPPDAHEYLTIYE